MKHVRVAIWILIVGLCLAIPSAGVAEDKPAAKAPLPGAAAAGEQKVKPTPQRLEGQASKPAAPPSEMIAYRPPRRGAPGGRVAGGSRGPSSPSPIMVALAPEDHVGLTVQEQPNLYWYASEPITGRVDFTLIDECTTQPLLEKSLGIPIEPGVQRIRLADYEVRLRPGVQYQWFVALVTDTDHRSRDVIAGGPIERIEPPQALGARLTEAGKAGTPYIYAEEGLWYDALRAISELIEAAPNDGRLRQQRASLLEQVGLPGVAENDLKGVVPGQP